MSSTPTSNQFLTENQQQVFIWRCGHEGCGCDNKTIGDSGPQIVRALENFNDRAPGWVGEPCAWCGNPAQKHYLMLQAKIETMEN